ncbi:MAG: (d)CMP kinase [Actinobacteria bacterium]|nr:(d)CMP kinase [Actinomycetota bacterium]
MSGPRVIAIDGAAGAGKSTLARALARELGLPYVNTGLMYRALAAVALRERVDLDDGDALAGLTLELRFRLTPGPTVELEVEGWTEEALTRPEVEAHVSQAARHPRVRELMRGLQRGFGESGGAVMEGRDIGTAVFPDAAVKIFLTADQREREVRRAEQRDLPEDVLGPSLRARDSRDSEVNPLFPAPDAAVIDTTDMGPEETLARALAVVRGRMR